MLTPVPSSDACIIYGIKNCSTMKKAFSWLDEHGVPYRFHDYRKQGVDDTTLRQWCGRAGWRTLVNTRGTTWRKLSAEQQRIDSDDDAIALMRSHPSVIRRPVIDTGGDLLLIGFDPDRYTVLQNRWSSP